MNTRRKSWILKDMGVKLRWNVWIIPRTSCQDVLLGMDVFWFDLKLMEGDVHLDCVYWWQSHTSCILFLGWCCRLAPGLEWSPAPRELVLPHESISISIGIYISCRYMMDIKARIRLVIEPCSFFQNLPSSVPSFRLYSLKVEDWLGMLKMLPCVWRAFTQWEKTRVLQLCPWCRGT